MYLEQVALFKELAFNIGLTLGRSPFVWKHRKIFSCKRNTTIFFNQKMERDERAPFEVGFLSFSSSDWVLIIWDNKLGCDSSTSMVLEEKSK